MTSSIKISDMVRGKKDYWFVWMKMEADREERGKDRWTLLSIGNVSSRDGRLCVEWQPLSFRLLLFLNFMLSLRFGLFWSFWSAISVYYQKHHHKMKFCQTPRRSVWGRRDFLEFIFSDKCREFERESGGLRSRVMTSPLISWRDGWRNKKLR